MFTKTTIKKSVLLLIALLMCLVTVFAACTIETEFKPVSMPNAAEVEGNGGNAVKYGDYIYYVNGYQSSSTASNSYSATIRVGAIVRIKVADLDEIIKINDEDLSTTKKTEAIEAAVAEKVELVVPNFYYTGNTTSTDLNGLNIFKLGNEDRLFITTPNSELDANGNILNSQLVLASYKLDGSDMQRHFVFESNAPQLKLTQNGTGVLATYVLSGKLYSLNVGEDSATEIATVTSPVFTGDYVYFLDEDGSICQFKVGGSEYSVLVSNEEDDGHNHTSYSIVSANNGYVYYKVSDSSSLSELKLFYATSETSGEIVLNTIPSGSYYGWQDKVVYTASVPDEVVTMYGIWTTNGEGETKQVVLDPAQNDSSITFNKLEGDTLYYTKDSISYTLNLAVAGSQPVAYAYSLSTTAAGWSTPTVLGNYVFTLSSGSVSVVKFNPETKKNSTSTKILLVAED